MKVTFSVFADSCRTEGHAKLHCSQLVYLFFYVRRRFVILFPGLPFLFFCNAWHTNLEVCSLYFDSVFIGCVNSRWAEFLMWIRNSSLEKRLDIMVVFYDFVFPHDLQHQQRPKLFLVSVLYHIFGAYFSVALVCSRFCWLQSGMQQKFPISCLMQLLGNLPLIFFFVPYRLPGIGFILSCTRPVLSLDSL